MGENARHFPPFLDVSHNGAVTGLSKLYRTRRNRGNTEKAFGLCPYKGTPEALTDTMNGRVDYFFAPVIAALPMVRDNRVTALAVGSAKRASVLPDVPTTEEAGYPGSAYNFWVGMLAPAGTPTAIVDQLNKEVTAALASPEVKDRLAALGADAAPMPAADFDKMIAQELKDNAALVKQAGITVQ
jgi:tripartite-type tricarboxylate transporter receptor subunit TctC